MEKIQSQIPVSDAKPVEPEGATEDSQTQAEWWAEDAKRLAEMDDYIRANGLAVGTAVKPPKLNPDGSLAQAETKKPDPATAISSEAGTAEKKDERSTKQILRDTLARLGIPIVSANGGGCVITGVKPH